MLNRGSKLMDGQETVTLDLRCNCCPNTLPFWGCVAPDLEDSATRGLLVMARAEGWERYYKVDGEPVDVCPECTYGARVDSD